MRVLIVDNTMDRDSWGAADFRRLLGGLARGTGADAGVTLAVRRAPEGDLPSSPRDFDRIILSGSRASALEEAPWISELYQLVRSALNENIPILGVCYGHQVLANVLGEKNHCHRAGTPELGWTKIERTGNAPLFEGLPTTFYSFSRHFEEVRSLPHGTRALAHSEACAIQAFQLGDRPVYGIQFHPERDLEGARHSLLELKKKKSAAPLLRADQSDELYDPKVGETIFRNFLQG